MPLEWLVSKVKLVEDSSALATDLVISSKEGKELVTLVKVNVEQLRNLALALEQMLILVYNPEYNILKVAGGTVAGLTRKAEWMVPAAEKNRKTTYFYDMFNKKLIYVADSRSKLSKVLNMSKGFFLIILISVTLIGFILQILFTVPWVASQVSDTVILVIVFYRRTQPWVVGFSGQVSGIIKFDYLTLAGIGLVITVISDVNCKRLRYMPQEGKDLLTVT